MTAATMPAEFTMHEGTIMAWPCRDEIWRTPAASYRRQAELAYAQVARSISRFEPVVMVARPEHAESAADLCGSDVEVVVLDIDDSWARDSGPIYVTDPAGVRSIVDYRFNAWGRKFMPYADDSLLATRWAQRRGEPVIDASAMVLEGGSISVDGEGTLLTTEQCLLHPNRNPDLTRAQIERGIRNHLGVESIIWMPFGLALDDDTDGHVDNVAAFARPGVVLMQGCDDPREADFDRMRVNIRCVSGAVDARNRELEVVEIPVLPFVEFDSVRCSVPYLNLYVCNAAVIVPVSGHAADTDALALIASVFPGREVVPVDGTVIALGGGGPHCITQQIPAGA